MWGGGSSNRNASRDESVEAGDKSVFDCRGGGVPVTGMLAEMNLSKPGINLSKPGMNLSKPGKKHRNHVIIVHKNG